MPANLSYHFNLRAENFFSEKIASTRNGSYIAGEHSTPASDFFQAADVDLVELAVLLHDVQERRDPLLALDGLPEALRG